MNKKETKVLDKLIQYLNESSSRIIQIRKVLDINPSFDFYREIQTIEMLYRGVLEDRKKYEDTYIFASTSGWTIEYLRNNKKYKKDEKFKVKIYFSFVEEDTFDDC